MLLKENACYFAIFILLYYGAVSCSEVAPTRLGVEQAVEIWSRQIGKELYSLSTTITRKREITQSFKALGKKIYTENGETIIKNLAENIRELMVRKEEAVKRIADYAEFLAYHRKTDPIDTDPDSDFHYFRYINVTEYDEDREEELENYVEEAECEWWCVHPKLPPLTNNMFTKKNINMLFASKSNHVKKLECDCNAAPTRIRPRPYFFELPLKHSPQYGYNVNFNISIVKVATNVYDRETDILQGVRWSEALDLVFKDNLLRDPTLKYQYFASPVGYMRHYPAVQWSEEMYDRTYDFRMRSWYTESMTSPKDIIILLDVSGSMHGKSKVLAHQVVNNILDTLNDNDFINIYLFNNLTIPVVDCFADILVQANEENLRLLRESLNTYEEEFVGNLSLGINKTFEILSRFKNEKLSSQCHQALMIITDDDNDYFYEPEWFAEYNEHYNTSVRVFTYVMGIEEDRCKQMEWIACTNRGYFANVSVLSEIREKVLNYINVMSRPLNYKPLDKQVPIWSYLQIDFADRRYSNWLWKKFEGNRQREVFLDHVKRVYQRLGQVLTSNKHILLEESHDYKHYKKHQDFDYMTTVSLPVYGRREDDVDLVGVAAVDVPIRLLYSLVPHHKLGVNGYAFIITNNGYLLMHPDHRREFENIPKPTFNRVDLLEVEIMEDKTEPRLFGDKIVKLRDKMVNRQNGSDGYIKVKFALDDMKRVILGKRRYYYQSIGPFTLGIALPDKYGLMVVNNTHHRPEFHRTLKNTQNWAVHPDWIYCKDGEGKTPKQIVLNCLKDPRKYTPLLASLLFDANATRWFEDGYYQYLRKLWGSRNGRLKDHIFEELEYVKNYFVATTFVATHSGLTRWRTFENIERDFEDYENIFESSTGQFRAIDEHWYKRAVEENYKNEVEDSFIYSVPFEISGYENNTMITSTNAIFVEDSERRTPVAVVGLQFNHRAMENLYRNITKTCNNVSGCAPCRTQFLECFILDNNAYVIFSDEMEHTGRFIGDIKPDIMYHLVENNVYKPVRMFDYQAICQKPPPEPDDDSAAGRPLVMFRMLLNNLLQMGFSLMTSIVMVFKSVVAGPDYQSIRPDTIAFENLVINKTLPTPCDHEMFLFTLGDKFNSSKFFNDNSKFVCKWKYVVQRIPNSNLIFLAINGICPVDVVNAYHNTPTPREIVYNNSLPCYIAINNRYSRRVYMKCFHRNEEEDKLNAKNRFYCGHTWK